MRYYRAIFLCSGKNYSDIYKNMGILSSDENVAAYAVG